MFRKISAEAEAIEALIVELKDQMLTMEADSEEYATCMNRLERMDKLREKNSHKGLDPNTLLIAGGNLLGIVIIVWHEQAHVITSKALSFAGKLR